MEIRDVFSIIMEKCDTMSQKGGICIENYKITIINIVKNMKCIDSLKRLYKLAAYLYTKEADE